MDKARFASMIGAKVRSAGQLLGLRSTRSRILAGALAVAVVLTVGLVVGFRMVLNRMDNAIPQTDLFGSSTPTPSTSVDASPTGEPSPPPSQAPDGADITGPLNILLAGHDMWAGESFRTAPHSDVVMVLHIDATLTHAYITSLPRDLLVNVPAFGPSGSGADYTKLTHAMTYGARVPGTGQQNVAQGFALLAQTVSAYTGIPYFDAGAVIDFDGLPRLVDAIGGLDIYVDAPVTSIHMGPDGTNRYVYGGPFMHYSVGMHHFVGWQALDYARQRYGLPNGAYDRERHHRQLVKAMIAKIFSFDLIQYPFTPAYVVQAVGGALTLDLRGRRLHEFAYALRNLRPEAVTLVGIPGGSVFSGGTYLGEAQAPIQSSYFAAVRSDTVAQFLAANPTLINDPR